MATRVRTNPRKMPSQSRSRDTVDAILAATARVLVKEGYDRASTNKIALAAGVSIGSLYQYFPSKEALVAALIDRHNLEMLAICETQLAALANEEPGRATRSMVRAMLRAYAVEPRLHKVLIEQVPRTGELNRICEFDAQIAALVRGYLEAHRDKLLPQDLDLAVFVVMSAVQAVTQRAVLERPEALGGEALVEEIALLTLRYLTGAG
jgi:AcrR family transcriptional regulator